MTARLNCASDQLRFPRKWDVSNPRLTTWRFTIRIAPAELACNPSARITSRQFVAAATTSFSWASVQLLSHLDFLGMSIS